MRKARKSLRMQFSMPVAISLFIIILAIVFIISQLNMNTLRTQALAHARDMGGNYANQIKAELDVPLDTARTLAHILPALRSAAGDRRQLANSMLRSILQNNPSFLGIWTCWEPNAFDGLDAQYRNVLGHDASGRYVPYYSRSGTVIELDALVDYEKPGDGDYYLLARNSRQEQLIEPYTYTVAGRDMLITTVSVPIIIDGRVLGVAGVDIAIDTLQELVSTIRPLGTGVSALFANKGTIVGHFDPSRIGRQMRETEGDMAGDRLGEFASAIEAGNLHDFTIYATPMGGDVYILSTPVRIGSTQTSWGMAVGIPMVTVLAAAVNARNIAIIIGIIGVAIIALIILLIATRIARRVNTLASRVQDLAEGEGDLTKRVEIDIEDELGVLAGWVNAFIENIHNDMKRISHAGTETVHVSKNLSQSSRTLSSTSDQIASQAENISSSATQMNQGQQVVASSIEEMSISINEVAKKASDAATASNEANTRAAQTETISHELRDNAQSINKVIELIAGIASQINLLALNAAIEAAGAGEAGRGFAVVAAEVKELAEQAARATEEIKDQVKNMQTSSGDAVTAITSIKGVINRVDEISSAIASSVEEQSITAREISGNMAQTAIAVNEVTRNITGVAEGAKSSASSASEVASLANQLSEASDELEAVVRKFKL